MKYERMTLSELKKELLTVGLQIINSKKRDDVLLEHQKNLVQEIQKRI